MNVYVDRLVLEAIDMASVVFQRVGGNASRLASHIRALNQTLGSLGGSGFLGFGATAGRILSMLLGMVLRLARATLDLTARIAGGLVAALGSLASAGGRAAAVVGGTLLAALVAIGRAGVDMNVTLERATMALNRLTGSSANADRFLGTLRQESLTSALTFKQLLPIAQQLIAAYGPTGIGRVIPTIRAFGDTASLLGVDPNGQERALLGFRQLLTRDKPTQEDLNQVSENLPGLDVKGILRKQFGSADTETLQDAGITGRQVADAIVAGMQEAFGGSQAAAAGTLPLILSNFEDAWNNFTAAITARFTPVLTAALGKVLAVLQGLAENQRVIDALSVAFDLLGAAVTAAADALPGFVDWLSGIVTRENVIEVLAQIAGWVKTLWDYVEGFLQVATGGGGLVGLWEAFQGAAKTALDLALRGLNALAAGFQFLGQHSDEIWAVVQAGINGAVDAMDLLIGGATILMGILSADKIAGIVAALGPLIAIAASLGLIPGTGGGSASPGHVNAGMDGGIDGMLNNLIRNALGNIPAVRDLRNAMSGNRSPQTGPAPAPPPAGGVPPWISGPAQAAMDWAFKQNGLRNLGRGIRGATGDFLNTNIPQGLKDFGGGLIGAIQGGFQSGGLDDLLNRQSKNAADARGAINRFLGPASPAASNEIPRIIMGQAQPKTGAGSGVVAPLPDKKQLKQLEAAREAYFRMLESQAKAWGALLGSGEETAAARAWADLQAQVPALEEKQASLAQRMQELASKANASAEDMKEYYDAGAEWAQAEERKAELRERYQDAEKRDGERSRRVLQKQADLAVAAVENNPLLSGQAKGEALANVLAQKFALLSTPQKGETEEEALDRQMEAQRTRGDIFKALGLGMKTVGLLGGGSLEIGNRQRMLGVNDYLNRIAEQAGQAKDWMRENGMLPAPGGGDPTNGGIESPMPDGTIAPYRQQEMRRQEEEYWRQRSAGYQSQSNVTVNAPVSAVLPPEAAAGMLQDPRFAAAMQQFMANWFYQASHAANPGPG